MAFTEVRSEVLDACGEQGDLYFAGSGVVFVGTEFLDDFSLFTVVSSVILFRLGVHG